MDNTLAGVTSQQVQGTIRNVGSAVAGFIGLINLSWVSPWQHVVTSAGDLVGPVFGFLSAAWFLGNLVWAWTQNSKKGQIKAAASLPHVEVVVPPATKMVSPLNTHPSVLTSH